MMEEKRKNALCSQQDKLLCVWTIKIFPTDYGSQIYHYLCDIEGGKIPKKEKLPRHLA